MKNHRFFNREFVPCGNKCRRLRERQGYYYEKSKNYSFKTTLDKELAEEYGAEGLTACPMMKEGQVNSLGPLSKTLFNAVQNIKNIVERQQL